MKKLLFCLLALAMFFLIGCSAVVPSAPEETTTTTTTEPELPPEPLELRMTDTLTVFEVFGECENWGGIMPIEIRMRCEFTGEETLLVDNERGADALVLLERLNERFFTYQYEWAGAPSGVYIYDLTYEREIFSLGQKIFHDGRAYVLPPGSEFRCFCAVEYVHYFYLSELEGNAPIEPRPAGMTLIQLLAFLGHPTDCNCRDPERYFHD